MNKEIKSGIIKELIITLNYEDVLGKPHSFTEELEVILTNGGMEISEEPAKFLLTIEPNLSRKSAQLWDKIQIRLFLSLANSTVIWDIETIVCFPHNKAAWLKTANSSTTISNIVAELEQV